MDGTDRFVINGKASPGLAMLDALRACEHACDVTVTSGPGELADIARTTDCERLWVFGGDGTVHEAVQGLMDRPDEQRPALAVVPLGTGNDFARAIGVHTVDAARWIEARTRSTTRTVDLCTLGEHAFVNQFVLGYSASVAESTPAPLKDRFGPLAYLMEGVARAGELQAFEVRLQSEGHSFEGEALVVSVGSGGTGLGGMPIHPDAAIDDGLLSVLVLPVPGAGPLQRWTSASVTVEVSDTVPADMDGDGIEGGGGEVRVLPGGLVVAMPPRELLRPADRAS